MYINKQGTAVPHIDVGEKTKLRMSQWITPNANLVQMISFNCLSQISIYGDEIVRNNGKIIYLKRS